MVIKLMTNKIRYCGDPNLRSETCVCLTCFNKSCIANYGKICLQCNFRGIDVYHDTGCKGHYSWTDKLKNKKCTIFDYDLTYIPIKI